MAAWGNTSHHITSNHREYLYAALGDVEQRNIQGAAAEVVHEHVMHIRLLVQLVSDRRRCGFLDHAHHLYTTTSTQINMFEDRFKKYVDKKFSASLVNARVNHT